MQSSVLFTRRGISHVLTLALLMTCLGVIAPATILAVDPVDENQQMEIGKVIEQLKSGRFNERETASRQLAEFGRAAIGPLTEAAMSKQREVTMRAIDILKKHLASTDAETHQAAKAALEQIAAGPQASAARQAQQVLNPPAEPEPEAAPPAGRIQVFGGPIQIRVQAGVAGNQRIRIKQVNGTKEIEAEENGRKVTIKEDQKNGIQMEVTEKKDGKETTKKYAAKNADELAKKHPDAHKLYKKYTDQPKFNFKFPNLQQAIPLVPGKNQLPPNFRLPPGLIPQQAKRSLEKANQELDKSIKELEEATKELKIETKDAEKLRRILDQLKSSRKELDQARSQLGGR